MPRKADNAANGQVTLAMVALRAGVSPQTVSNALNSPDLLKAETLVRVQRAVRELDYRPNRPRAPCAPAPAGSSATAYSLRNRAAPTPFSTGFCTR